MSGLATIFNFYGNYSKFPYSKSPTEADRRALESDWEAVGHDIQGAINHFSDQSNDNVNSAKR